ncbi:MAG: hypothetical protein EOO75_10405, partial [Myxococcales bacterium]
MTAPAPRTFRDFASEVFAGDLPAAAATLTDLLGLDPGPARAAAEQVGQGGGGGGQVAGEDLGGEIAE